MIFWANIEFFPNISYFRFIKPMVKAWKLRINEYLYDILANYEMDLKFYLITNDQITAIFLARYIAKKLVYRHKLKWLLNPLKQEFKVAGRLGKTIPTWRSKLSKFFKMFKLYWYVLLLCFLKMYDEFVWKTYCYSYFRFSFILFSLKNGVVYY